MRSKSKSLLHKTKRVSQFTSTQSFSTATAPNSFFSSNLFKVGLTATIGSAIVGSIIYSQSETFHASDKLDPPPYPWSHRLPWQALDHASIRRGHKVFSQVCSTCHSLNLVHFRNLVDVCYTEAEAKAIAADLEYVDGPDEEGNMFSRPGKLSDPFPRPYENDKQARAINNGARPPDLSSITKARHDGTNYLFALLTGYKDPAAGVALREGLYYNPYFAGSSIAMPNPLTEGMVEYEDGTEGSVSQMAKDVSTFLSWASEPEMEERKRVMSKTVFVIAMICVPLNYYKRFCWSLLKMQKINFNGKFGPEKMDPRINWRRRQ